MKDFSLAIYAELIDALSAAGYSFQTFEGYLKAPNEKVVLLRHDVDSWPINALHMAETEASRDIKATYYFRKSKLSFKKPILKRIVELQHEIGYHYEDLAACNGNLESAIKRFETNLNFFRCYYPVETIAMHGRPLSKWDSKDLWNEYDYHGFGLIGEPYLDLDFSKMLYLTDTGNRWDGDKYSIRDHVPSAFKFNISSTYDLIEHIHKNKLPQQIMLNVHPARWNDNLVKWWIRDYILSKPKYVIKKWVKEKRNR